MNELESRLILTNLVKPEQLTIAGQEAARCGKSVWAALARLGYLSEEEIALFFAQEAGIAYVRIADYKVAHEVLGLLDETFCRQNSVFPLFKVKSSLFVACGNPLDAAITDTLARMTGLDVEPLVSTPRSITQALDHYWGPEDRVFEMEKLIARQAPLKGVKFFRESERVPLDVPVALKIEDDSVILNASSFIEGHTRNISAGGTAVGLYTFLFLPRGTRLALEFKPNLMSPQSLGSITVKGEIVYCRMEKSRDYYLGIKFIQESREVKSELMKLARIKKS